MDTGPISWINAKKKKKAYVTEYLLSTYMYQKVNGAPTGHLWKEIGGIALCTGLR